MQQTEEVIRENTDMKEIIYPDMNRAGLADIHCHILPGIDDGSRTTEESTELIGLAYEQGFRTFTATSHYSRRHDNPDIEGMTAALNEAVHKKYPDVMIYPGHETFYHEELPERIDIGQARRINGGSYVLVEFDLGTGFGDIMRGLRRISEHGYTPVLAHFERYAALREGERAAEIKRAGTVMQMNYECIRDGGLFNRDVRWCRKQVESGITDLFGTDMHRTDYRPPDTMNARQWLRKKTDSDRFDMLTRRNALHILRDEDTEQY